MSTAPSPETVPAEVSREAGVPRARVASVDILRGLVMVVMALDHARDYLSNSAALFDPTDLTRTPPALFFTRWITYLCAPVFVFLAGSSAYLWQGRGKEASDLARFLGTRGLWLVALEIFVVSPLGWSFNLLLAFTALQVIWVIGVSMILLALGVLLFRPRVIGGVGVTMILLHNVFDGAHAAWLGRAAGAWKWLH